MKYKVANVELDLHSPSVTQHLGGWFQKVYIDKTLR